MDLKTFAIETLEIAEWNVLKAIFRLQPEDFEIQTTPNFNSIRWIIEHLTLQMDIVFNHFGQGKRLLSEKQLRSLSIKELIEAFLQVSNATFAYLRALPEKKFHELPEHNELASLNYQNTETMSELIQRVALHFLGHTGQIIWIKKHLGKGGSFVMGVKKNLRDESRMKWLKWWSASKEKYS